MNINDNIDERQLPVRHYVGNGSALERHAEFFRSGRLIDQRWECELLRPVRDRISRGLLRKGLRGRRGKTNKCGDEQENRGWGLEMRNGFHCTSCDGLAGADEPGLRV